jgi:hypothetical protein
LKACPITRIFPSDQQKWKSLLHLSCNLLTIARKRTNHDRRTAAGPHRGDDERTLTRIARWAPGTDTSANGVIRHDYFEEVLLLDGDPA